MKIYVVYQDVVESKTICVAFKEEESAKKYCEAENIKEDSKPLFRGMSMADRFFYEEIELREG